MLNVVIKEYHCFEDIFRDMYIYDGGKLVFSIEQTKEEIDLSQILKQVCDGKTAIVRLFRAIYCCPSFKNCKNEYFCEFFTFDGNCLIPLEPSKDIKIELPFQLPEEITLSVWIDDYRDWGGKRETNVYLSKELEEKLRKIEIDFYKKIGENKYEYWISFSQGFGLGRLYNTGVLQDIFKALGVKKLKIEEHERISYHPTSLRLFGLKDKFYDRTYELSLENRDIKNRYIVIQDEDEIDIYVELSKD